MLADTITSTPSRRAARRQLDGADSDPSPAYPAGKEER
jgi:hypothetical protein